VLIWMRCGNSGTLKRIFDRLIAEHAMVDMSYQVVRAYVAVRKPEIRAWPGRSARASVPSTGMEAEVDLGEVAVRLRGTLVTCFLFSLRLSLSDKTVRRPGPKRRFCR
jgi:hypothetical protein